MGQEYRLRSGERAKFRIGLAEALLEHARRRFALDKPDPTTGKSRLTVLLEIQKQTKVTAPDLLSMPRIPLEVQYLWDWFSDLSAARTAGFSVNAITWSDLQAYFRLVQICPEPWEVRTIRSIDSAYLASRADSSTGGEVKDATALQQQVKPRKA